MKKLLMFVLVTAIIALGLAGCKQTPKSEHPTGELPAKAQPPKDHPAH